MPKGEQLIGSVLAGMVLAALVLTTGCGSARRGEPLTGRLDRTGAEVQRGEIVFQSKCHQCHPGGEGGLGPALNDKPAPAWLMKTQVRLGLGAMPAFGEEQISSEQLDELMSYMLALRKDR